MTSSSSLEPPTGSSYSRKGRSSPRHRRRRPSSRHRCSPPRSRRSCRRRGGSPPTRSSPHWPRRSSVVDLARHRPVVDVGPGPSSDAAVLRVGPRTAILLALATVGGIVMFCWPLFVHQSPGAGGHISDAPFAFVLVLPVLVGIVLASFSEGGMDAKALAML